MNSTNPTRIDREVPKTCLARVLYASMIDIAVGTACRLNFSSRRDGVWGVEIIPETGRCQALVLDRISYAGSAYSMDIISGLKQLVVEVIG